MSTDSRTTQYYVQDQLGSTRGLLDSSGNIVGTYTYDAYGGLKGHGGTASTPFGYAGQYTDGETGLQYLRARYYDPSTQQFLTVDPLVGLTGEPYAYTAGNPVNGADPLGLCWPNWACRAENVAGSAVYGALPAIHQWTTGVTVAASICAVGLSETLVLGLICAGVAGGASVANGAVGVALWAQGRQSAAAMGVDVAGAGLGAGGLSAEVSARSAARLGEAANALSLQRRAEVTAAPWYGKVTPWLQSRWLALKGTLWTTVEEVLKGTSIGSAIIGIGAAIYGVVCT